PTIIAHQFTWPVGCALHFQRSVMPRLLFAHGKEISEVVAEWRCRSDIVRGPSPRDSVVWGVPTVFAPGYADDLAQDPADVLVEESCLIGRTGGPLGLTPDQANTVLASLRNAAPSIYRALEAAFGGANPYIPFYQDVELDPFAIDVYPVTNHLYDWYRQEVDKEAPDRLHYEGEDGSHPAQVTWEAARRYCEKMGRQLPTIRQWERAARGESQSILPWGDDLWQSWRDRNGRLRCNVSEARRGGPVPVFESEAGETRWGSGFVRDMIGNVPEWTSDRLPDGRVAVMGMGYGAPLAANVPSYYRYVDPNHRNAYHGFRCVSGSPR
ncbi:MAG: formylglycine-generating enzyme family protein, partial [Candidatus Hadarchaeum sp.]